MLTQWILSPFFPLICIFFLSVSSLRWWFSLCNGRPSPLSCAAFCFSSLPFPLLNCPLSRLRPPPCCSGGFLQFRLFLHWKCALPCSLLLFRCIPFVGCFTSLLLSPMPTLLCFCCCWVSRVFLSCLWLTHSNYDVAYMCGNNRYMYGNNRYLCNWNN